MKESCPCCSGMLISECCEPVINHVSAKSPLALMRSRYTAYHLQNAEYIYQTTYPVKRQSLTVETIAKWASESNWQKLEIIESVEDPEDENKGIVEFKAHLKNHIGVNKIYHERSSFIKEAGKWYYTEGRMNPVTSSDKEVIPRNAHCPCGSGKKYKKCCG